MRRRARSVRTLLPMRCLAVMRDLWLTAGISMRLGRVICDLLMLQYNTVTFPSHHVPLTPVYRDIPTNLLQLSQRY